MGPRGFAILSLFSRPLALGDAIDRLEAGERSATDFPPTLSVINMLIEEGALVGRARAGVRRAAGPIRWSTPACCTTTAGRVTTWPRSRRRCDRETSCSTSAPGAASSPSPRPGRAPRRVYAVEASDIAEVAERVFAANGVQDRVTLVPGWSRQIELPEQADLLVVGDHRQRAVRGGDPRDDARRPSPPAEAAGAADPAHAHAARAAAADSGGRGQTARDRARRRSSAGGGLYGIEFQPLLDAATPGPVHTPTEGEVVAGWPPVGPPVVLATLDLTAFDEASVRRRRRPRRRRGRARSTRSP